ncbi:serine/threonine protein kinase [Methanolobus vulcani]|jgi:serine/threonine-protein kinase|uniref:Serine/threonine protein kinase n=1 Tax=Methanolobus vulcani TaxID=38026 RepID=A0A7Z7FDV3_9EURY|nr:PASTA domain-containing protein [Methanolobus vulcani]SDF65702.1 serine/threonine protein kinase [Methanolobus vulcani]
MVDITDLRKNIESLNKATTAASKRKSYLLTERSIATIESEVDTINKELISKTDALEKLQKENLALKQEYNILDSRVKDIINEKLEIEKKLEQLSRTRSELSSTNLVKAFSDSLQSMDSSLKGSSSRVNYSISSMNIKLKTNIAMDGNDLRFQLPKADDVIPASNLSEVEFTITSSSKAPELASFEDVPGVVGLELESALSVIKEAGFVQGEIIEKDSELAQGTVLSQIPSGSSVAKPGDAVDLVISKITSVEIPDLTGNTLAAAKKSLADIGLSVGNVTEEINSMKAGTIIGQSVEAGSYTDIGSAIDLVVASSKIEFAAVSGKTTVNPIISRSVDKTTSDISTRISSTRRSVLRK